MRKLTHKETRFIEEYLNDLNGAAAARRAGYAPTSARAQAWEILKRPRIRAAIEAAIAERSERTAVSRERVLQELGRIAFANVRDVAAWQGSEDGGEILVKGSDALDAASAAAIAEVVQTPKGVKVKLYDKQAALTNLCRHFGLFNDKLEVGAADDLAARLLAGRARASKPE